LEIVLKEVKKKKPIVVDISMAIVFVVPESMVMIERRYLT